MSSEHSNSELIDLDEIFGLTEKHLSQIEGTDLKIHTNSQQAFANMQAAAAVDGIDIRAASAYRSFERQLAIWNAKASGQRDCLDDRANCIDLTQLTDLDAVKAIMRFSALPGASRHHWGTDLDIYDAAAVAEGYNLKLVASEYESGGPFHKLNLWLELRSREFGFSRPYATDQGGIAPEAWHISHIEQANSFSSTFSSTYNPDALSGYLRGIDLLLKDAVLNNLQYLFERYIQIT